MAIPTRVRIIIDTEEVYRRAVHLRASAEGRTSSEVLGDLIKEHFKPEIAIARRVMKEKGQDTDTD